MTQSEAGSNQKIVPTGETDVSKPGVKYERQYVRIFYPQDCAKKHLPVLIIRYRTYQILDISEAGICFRVPNMKLIQDDILTGVIKFTDETTIDISGVVVRRTKVEIAMKLIIGIPYSYILTEQVRLRNLAAEGEITYIEKQ